MVCIGIGILGVLGGMYMKSDDFGKYKIFQKLFGMFPVRPAAPGRHNATLIFLHGLGDSENMWCESLSEVCPPHIKIMCPNAPIQPVTMTHGKPGPSWFDIKTVDIINTGEDEQGVISSSDRIKKYVQDEVKNGIPHGRIVIGGFSQGGALALHVFATHDKKLAGCIGLSTFLPLRHKFHEIKHDANKDTKIFLAHSYDDDVVQYKFGALTKDVLRTHYTNVQWNQYDEMGHATKPDEMKDLKKYLGKVLPQL